MKELIANAIAWASGWLLSAGAWLIRKARELKPKPAAIVIGVLLGIAGAQAVHINGVHIAFHIGPFNLPFVEVDGLKDRATKAEKALADLKSAQAKAKAAQVAVNHIPAVKSANIARETDAQTPEYLARVAAAAAGHALPVGRVCGNAPEGGVGAAGVSGTDRASQSDDHTAGASELVSVARSDWDKIVREAGLRAQLYQAGQALIAEGVAVEDTSAESTPLPSGDP